MTNALGGGGGGDAKDTTEFLSPQDTSEDRTYSPLPMREIVIHHTSNEENMPVASSMETSLIKEEPKEEDIPNEARVMNVMMECFGLQLSETDTFCCLQHKNETIATGLLPNSTNAPVQLRTCRMCFQEETMVAPSSSSWTLYQILQFLQTLSPEKDWQMETLLLKNASMLPPSSTDPLSSSSKEKDLASSLSDRILYAFQHSGPVLESALLRLQQVHRWNVQSQMLQLQQCHQQMFALQQQNLQYQATIKQLRRTIQQDCKFIKTMATQQQDVEQALGLSNHGSDTQGSPKMPIARSRSSISQSMHNAASAHVIHESLGEEEETTETTAADDFLQSPPVTETNTPNPSSLIPSWNAPLQRRSLKSSTEIFRSFRGGLLDPPSSPPVPVRAMGGGNNKLTLDSDARHALQIPKRGLLSRSNSIAGDAPLEVMLAPLDTVFSSLPNAPFSPAAAEPAPEEEEEDDTPPDNAAATVFRVTGATSRDKFGDEGVYTGPILVTEGLPHGPNGRMEYESGRIYDGDWISGQWHGRGRLLNPNGDSYEGDFCFDARHGQGVYRWDNGDVYVGNFTSDKRHGKGKFCFHNGNVYEGEFLDGLFDGYGKYVFAGGTYEGNWKDGRYNGTGVLTYSSTGGKYTGEFRNSVAHGFGIEILPDGRQRRGMWVDGKPTEYLDDAKQQQASAKETE